MTIMKARERLYLNADRTRVVGDGHKDASFLYAAVGDEIPASAAEKLGIVDGLAPGHKKRDLAETLLGSSVQPAQIDIGGKTVQLGVVVTRAHKDSGLDVDAWNALPEAEREALLVTAIAAMTADAARPKAAKAARPPAAGKKPTKAAAPVKEQKQAEDKENKGGDDKGAGNDQGGAQQQPT